MGRAFHRRCDLRNIYTRLTCVIATRMPDNTKLAIVKIAATDHSPATLLIEVAFGDQTITISDQATTITDAMRGVAQHLIDLILNGEDN